MTFIKQNILTLRYLVLSGLVIFIFSCNNFKKNNSHASVPNANIAKGKVLAAKYCQSCHMLPDPSLLDSKHWEIGVLPAMGPRFGIFNYGFNHYPSSRNDINLDRNFYPSQPALSAQEWQYIIDYYTSVSPDSLPGQQRKYPVKDGSSLFELGIPSFKKPLLPTTCFVHIDTLVAPRQVIISDVATKNIFRFNNQLQLLDSFQNISPVVDMEVHEHDITTCNIGVMNPNNGKSGSAIRIIVDEKGEMKVDSSMKFNNLARPVQVTSADFNADGKMDYLVCEFGNLIGALSWMENLGNNKFERHVLRGQPGAIKAYIRDVNHDGLPDIWVLFAQGEEGVFLFTNKGHGKFEQEQVLRFPPIYGSSYFELADFNKDGFPDIVYTCGDNEDFSIVLKPYHGIYIFLNDGSNHFKQQYFFPMHGCFKALARDFDGDGDLDIAAISFFADYAKHPEESFIYLENKGNFDFQPYSLAGATSGRWLAMDAADLDGDGKTDLVLGNFSIAPVFVKGVANWKQGPPFIVLKNIMKK
jgi:hypothetical protein